jgi:hypothetical protein
MDSIKIQRWTVVGRETDDLGRVSRSEKGYKRTAVPQEEREEHIVRFSSRLRVMVSWGGVPVVATAEFSLTSGRCIGHPDWILIHEHLKPLRKLARAAFPKEKKKDDESKAPAGEASQPAETTQREVVVAAPSEPNDGSERPVPEPAAPDRQRNLFPE